MPKVRTGVISKKKRGTSVIGTSDIKAVVQAAQTANNVPALRQAVADLAILLGYLAEAVGLEPKTE